MANIMKPDGIKRGRKTNVRPAKGFTRQMKGGPAAHKETVRRARQAAIIEPRRRRAWEYLLADCTFDQIGKLCGVSNYTAWKDCYAYWEGLRQRGLDDAELLLGQQNGQIAALIRSHWVTKKDKSSADVILRAMERRARLYGLDRQREELRGYSYEQVQGLLVTLRDGMLAAFAEPELRARVISVLDTLNQRVAEPLAAARLETKVG